MPPRKLVNTLKRLCIQGINKNIDTYRLQEIKTLPTTVLEDLIHFQNGNHQEFVSKNKFKMITENFTRLSLSFKGWDRDEIAYALRSIPNQFKNMKRFSCDGRLTHQEILNFVRSFPNIIDLTLKCGKVNDDILKAIGDNCPNLERLTLTRGSVTDVGIRRLCHSKSCGSNIKYLDLVCLYRLTAKGHLMALQNLNQLRVFNGWKTADALIKLFQDLNGSEELPIFELCELPLIYNMENIPTGFLNFLTECCPNASSLPIQMSKNFLNDVIEVKKCEKILPLKICLSYEEYSMSHLTDVGSNVTKLSIQIYNIDLELIGNVFPNLKHLYLSGVTYLPIVDFKSKNSVMPFRKLHELIIVETIDVLQLKFLLQNCLELEDLRMYYTDIDADSFISLIHRVNPLKHLTRFEIDAPFKVIVLELLKMENNLQFVEIEVVGDWSRDDKSEIECYVKENNLCTCVRFIRKNRYKLPDVI